MIVLTLGLLLFLGVHSIRIFADDWRAKQINRLGEGRWKALYALASAAGFALLICGFVLARSTSLVVWTPPKEMRLAAAGLTFIAFVFVAAAYVPGNRIKARVSHPMVLGTMIWAIAHLLANGRLAHAELFGAFLLWAAVDLRAVRERDRAVARRDPVLGLRHDVVAVAAGAIVWALFAAFGHKWLIGVPPLD